MINLNQADCRWVGRSGWHIKASRVNKELRDFTLAQRPFTAYGADKVEAVLRHVGLLDEKMFYVRFDADTDELVFGLGAGAIADILEKAYRGFGIEAEYEIIDEDKELPIPPKQLKP